MNNPIRKSSLWGWCLLDFANSIPAVIGGIYFSKWFTENLNAGSVLLNTVFISSALIIFLTGKFIGKKVDKYGYKPWIVGSSIISILAILLLFILSQLLEKDQMLVPSFILFLLFLFGYQISRVCHNVYLRSIIPEKLQSKMSGYGTAANWAGSIFGIILTIPILSNFQGSFARELTFLVAGLAFGILTPISLLLMFRSNQKVSTHIISENVAMGSWKIILRTIGISLIAYLLLFDVMGTVQRNLPPYLTSVFGMNDDIQAKGFLTILIAAMVGGIFSGKFIGFYNALVWLKISTLSLAVAIFMIVIKSETIVWVSFVIAGLSYGILESSMRIHFMKNFSAEVAGNNFGLFAVVERMGGIMGPLLWIIPFNFIMNEKKANLYSMALMGILAIIALVLLFAKKEKAKANLWSE